MNRSTKQTFILVFGVVAILLLMGLLPTFSINDFESRPVKILSDIFVEEDTSANTSTVALEVKEVSQPLYQPEGVVLFEDFSSGKAGGMNHFWSKLLNASKTGSIHIAYFGDSFIESDILTCDLRNMLQLRYGGSGPSWIDCGGGVGTNKPTITSKYKNITENVILKKPFDVNLEAINQRYYYASSGASLSLSATQFRTKASKWNKATLFLKTDTKYPVSVSVNGGAAVNYELEAKDEVQTLEITDAAMKSITYTFPSSSTKTRLFGVALDGTKGVSLDNFNMRGTPGYMLSKIPVKTLKEIYKYRPYDLVILQFGLNVVNDKATDAHCRAYINQMKNVIENMKKAFPNASIVVFSVPDRVQRSGSGFHTLKGVERLVGFQRVLASECGVAFLNVHEIMGGNESMKDFVDKGLAAKDYTHLNYKGGEYLAGQIYKSIEAGVENYRRSRKK